MNEAIILAGGQGTRLHPIVQNVPKPMADINGQPFLQYLLEGLNRYGISKVIFAVGYKHEAISTFFGDSFKGCTLQYSIEDSPLGTGGAIKKALALTESKQILIVNGDTLFDIDFAKMFTLHTDRNADLTLAVKPMRQFDRYGTVVLDNGRVCGFLEKAYCESGFINGGVYLLNKSCLHAMPSVNNFSFENDFLEKKVKDLSFYAYVSDMYFIDIGIPTDYKNACTDFERKFH